jgi:hypothetical protein
MGSLRLVGCVVQPRPGEWGGGKVGRRRLVVRRMLGLSFSVGLLAQVPSGVRRGGEGLVECFMYLVVFHKE